MDRMYTNNEVCIIVTKVNKKNLLCIYFRAIKNFESKARKAPATRREISHDELLSLNYRPLPLKFYLLVFRKHLHYRSCIPKGEIVTEKHCLFRKGNLGTIKHWEVLWNSWTRVLVTEKEGRGLTSRWNIGKSFET